MSPNIGKQQPKKPEQSKPKVPPERECWHRTIFTLVCYGCLLVLLVTGVPRIKTMFTPRGSTVSESALVQHLSDQLNRLIEVRLEESGDDLPEPGTPEAKKTQSGPYYRYGYRLGSHWYSLLAPILVIVALTVMIKDKAAASRVQYWLTVGMGVALISGCAMLLLEIFRHTTSKMG